MNTSGPHIHKHTYVRAEEAKARMVVWSGAADSRDREIPWQDEGSKAYD